MTTYQELFDNNVKWIVEKTRSDHDFFHALLSAVTEKGQDDGENRVAC